MQETAGKKGIIGYAVPSTRHAPVHHNKYMRLYRMIEETDMPISFHAGYHGDDPSLKTVNRFLGMHALGFAWPNIVHCTNWVLNGMPVRFPKLKVIWIELGIAWAPFLMQRLDHQFLMPPWSEAPHLKRLPSEYMRDHRRVHDVADGGCTNLKALECTLEMIKVGTYCCRSRPTGRISTSTCPARSPTCRSCPSSPRGTSSASMPREFSTSIRRR